MTFDFPDLRAVAFPTSINGGDLRAWPVPWIPPSTKMEDVTT